MFDRRSIYAVNNVVWFHWLLNDQTKSIAVMSAYHFLTSTTNNNTSDYSRILQLKVVPLKVSLFDWRLLLNRILTKTIIIMIRGMWVVLTWMKMQIIYLSDAVKVARNESQLVGSHVPTCFPQPSMLRPWSGSFLLLFWLGSSFCSRNVRKNVLGWASRTGSGQ